MVSLSALLQLALALVVSASISFPATRTQQGLDSENMHVRARRSFTDNPAYKPSGPLWFINVDFGDTKNVRMVIDSATEFLYIDSPGLYKPSAEAKILNKTRPNDPHLNHTKIREYGQTKYNGCGQLYFAYNGYKDTVKWGPFTLKDHKFGVSEYTNASSFSSAATDDLEPEYDGIAGFLTGNFHLVGEIGGRSMVTSLYNQGQIDEDRFGLAFGTAGKGQVVVGGVDESLFEGNLTILPQNYVVSATVNGTVVVKNLGIFLDSGGPGITAPMNVTRAIFKSAGIEGIPQSIDCYGSQQQLLYGYYPCDAPPRIGLEIAGVNFDFEPEALKWKDDGANNCTSIITGHPGDIFVLGNAFFQGKYVDYRLAGKSFAYDIGWANLKNQTDPGSPNLTR